MVDYMLKLQLETILKISENDKDLIILSINTNNSCGPCDNFMSIATVTDVQGIKSSGERFSWSLFIKVLPGNKGRCEIFNIRDAFQNESNAYTLVLKHIPEVEDIIPKYIIGGEEILVMENLGALGYKMADKKKGLDLKHSELVMKALGKLHASTFNLRNTKGEHQFDNFITTNFKDIRYGASFFGELVEKSVLKSLHTLRLAQDPSLELAISKLEHIIQSGDVINTMLDLHDSESLTVLCHGDCWINNMLFDYKGDEVKSVKLVDFQGMTLASPAIDLWTFFYSSISTELLNSYYDHLVLIYSSSFTNTLKDLETPSSEIPDIEDIKQEIDCRELYGFLISLMYVTVICSTEEDFPVDIDNYLGDKDAILNLELKTNPKIAETFSKIAKRCISRGVFLEE